jgi:hypothetical protein
VHTHTHTGHPFSGTLDTHAYGSRLSRTLVCMCVA